MFGFLLAAAIPALAGLASLSLPDLDGQTVTLAEYRGKSPVVVVFYRGSWCAYCVDQLVQLERAKGASLAGIAVIAVSPDAPAKTRGLIAAVAKERGVALTHRFLSDPKLAFADRYAGTGDPPAPKLVLLDRDGREVWTFSESHYQMRDLAPLLEAAVKRLDRSSRVSH